jgi:hypothetical protein
MNHSDRDNSDGVIKLTRDELMGSHVEDLLNRQKSLRGESGVSRQHRHWYYKNWFVFMVVGALAAIAAWAVLEPFFDDNLYIQGPIDRISTYALPRTRFEIGSTYLELSTATYGYIELNDQKVWILTNTKYFPAEDVEANVEIEMLREGQEVGIYVEYYEEGSSAIGLGTFLVIDPPENPPAKASLSLTRLNARSNAAGMFFFAMVAGFVGLALGGAEGVVCRNIRRALLGGAVGLIAGFIGGYVSSLLANLIYGPINSLAMKEMNPGSGSLSTYGFLVQMGGRTLSWGIAGMAMGLGQGIVLRSKRLFLYGFLGGLLGGLLGGILFDPIDLLLLGLHKPSAHLSRLVGLAIIGASVGAMIGVVELLARDAWLRMIEGPLAGKEFLIFKDLMRIGSSPRSEIYLFNDEAVADHHASLRTTGDIIELENTDIENELLVNNRKIKRARLRHGDRITVGRTVFMFEKRQG